MFVGCENGAVLTAMTFYIRDIGAVSGITELQSASLLSISAMIGFPVTVFTGFMLEKFKVRYILALSYFIQAISIVQMIYMNEMISATVFAVVWGLSSGLQQVALQYVWPYYYGVNCLGTINSLFVTSGVIGSAIGPIAYGVAIDRIGSWSTILWWTVPVALFSSLMLLLCGQKPVHQN